MRIAIALLAIAIAFCFSGCARPKNLSEAIEQGDTAWVRSYLKNGGSVEGGRYERAPLHRAAEHDRVQIAHLLISKGADVNAIQWGMAPLHMAAKRGRLDMVQFLVSKGARINLMGGDRPNSFYVATPLHEAAGGGHLDIVSYLVAKGAPVDAPGHTGETPLVPAARNGHMSVVQFLLSKGADVNAGGGMPLSAAACGADEAIALIATELLITHGADAKVVFPGGWSPLRSAVKYSNDRVARLLISKGARHDLFTASALGDKKAIERLIADGAKVNKPDSDGYTPLHWAAEAGQPSVVALLIRKGADANVANSYGYTPLHLALQGRESGKLFPRDPHTRVPGNRDAARVLILKGADVNAKVRNGFTPLDYARSAGYGDIESLLKTHGAIASWSESRRRQ